MSRCVESPERRAESAEIKRISETPEWACVVCGKPSYFSVGWLAPTRRDACAETMDNRPACSSQCAYKAAGK
jgi:hypothetical protein